MLDDMLRPLAIGLLVCAACSSNGTTGDDAGVDAASDATNACSAVTTDASFTCDVSAVPPAYRACATWASDDSSLHSCPGTVGWSGGIGGGCTYTWMKSGPPDLCELPGGDNGTSAFGWLHPTCASECDASIDVAPPTPCTTSTDCPSTQYCETNGTCAGSGTCTPIDSGGVGFGGQACGCDGKTYASYAAAHQARVSVAYAGACE